MQVCCYEDSKLLKLFTDIVRMLYDCDILAEDTINWWAKKASPGPLHASQSILLDTVCLQWHSWGLIRRAACSFLACMLVA